MGRCDFCRSEDVFCVEPKSLSGLLELTTECFDIDDNGDAPHAIYDRDFRILSPKVSDPELLWNFILGDEFCSKKYRLKYDTERYAEEWELLKDELIHRNRFFPKSSIYGEIFSKKDLGKEAILFSAVLDQLTSTRNEGDIFYRARVSSVPLERHLMGKPPGTVVTAGRANPAGIAYLYLAENVNTCLHEVRPSKWAKVYVSRVIVQKPIKLIDLRKPKTKVSILKFEEHQIESVLKHLNLLELFSSDLSKPVQPDKSHLDYVPTQFLCEYLSVVGDFDGLIFNSLFSTGSNVVLFDGSQVSIENPRVHKVVKTSVEYESVHEP